MSAVDLVKTAAEIDDDVDSLPATSFADPMSREYPVHTKEAVLLSAAYAAHAAVDDQVMRQIEKAAEFWEVPDAVRDIRQQVEGYRLQPKYAVEIQGQRFFHYHDRETAKQAADQFYDERHKFPHDARKEAAERLISAGGDYRTEVREYLDKAASLALPSDENARNMLLHRSRLLRRQPKQAEAVAKLAKVLDLLGEMDQADDGKVALAAFARFDEETGLAARYGRGLELPEERLFVAPLNKVAGSTDLIATLQNGQTIDVSTIDWDKVAEIDPALHEACEGGNLKTARDVLPTWPRGDADILVEMLDLQPIG